jgi:hypothetical protein
MTGKMKLYIGLLVLGIVLIGSGVWLLYDSAQAKVSIPEAKINIPEGNPVIYEKIDHIMKGEITYLYIYKDGSILYIEEKGLRMGYPERHPTRTWKTGKLMTEQLNSLIEYFQNSGLDKMDDRYLFPGKPLEGGAFTMSDMDFTISISSENLNKTVTAFGYMTPDNGETYPDMPSPLNEIYERLRVIALGTNEVAHENISQ